MTEGYRYTACGLDDVYLLNGYTGHETPYGEGVSIEDADGLHRVIALDIVTSPRRIRGQEVRFLRSQLELSQEGLARVLRTSRPTIARYEGSPDKAIPGSVETALRLFYAAAIDGDPSAENIVELLKELDELEHVAVMFEETPHGWIRAAA